MATVHEQGWDGAGDGDLLRRAEAGFDALVSMDKGIPHQQNLSGMSLRIVIVRAHSNRRAVLAPLIPAVTRRSDGSLRERWPTSVTRPGRRPDSQSPRQG